MNDKNQSPKAKQFSEELNELLAKYQYSLVPKVQYTENGIMPWLAIIEVVPPKGKPTPIQEEVKELETVESSASGKITKSKKK